MVEFNTRINQNGQILFVAEPKEMSLEEEFFNLFLDKSKKLILNDSGEESGLKNELREFDVSPDKEFGHEWHFKINEKSKPIIKKVFEANLTRGHRRWTLVGDDFSLTYIECGDMHDLMDGPSGSKTIYSDFIIKAKEKNLDDINSILKSYTIK